MSQPSKTWASIVILALASCQSQSNPLANPINSSASPSRGENVLRITCAADLRFTMPDLIAAFRQKYPAVQVEPTFGASGNLVAQIRNGLPVDVFLSADESYPLQLVKSGLAEQHDYFRYARGSLVLWVPRSSPLPIEAMGISVLTKADIRRLAVANPRTAPYGRAAVAFLEKAGLSQAYQQRIVLADNIAQALQYAESGNADAALIGKALALGTATRFNGRWVEVPSELYPPIIQGGVILRRASNSETARAWRHFLLSQTGRSILAKHGFTAPDTVATSDPTHSDSGHSP